MATSILIIGEPGTGKSRAIKDLNPKETIIIKPNKKELPFRGAAKFYKNGGNMVVTTDLAKVGALINDINTKYKQIKNIIIEDVTHYFSKRVIDERRKKGFDKWMELAAAIKVNIIDKEALLRDDLTFFIIGHVDEKTDKSGKPELTMHTPGKLLDRSVLIPSYFTYMFHTDCIANADGTLQYRFLTNRTEYKVAKTPEGMFPLYIANNYELIKRYIKSYQYDVEVDLTGITENINVSQDTVQMSVDTTILSASEARKTEDEPEEVSVDTVEDDGLSGESTEITLEDN